MANELLIIGLGPGSPDALSLGALRALRHLNKENAPIYLRTRVHPNVEWLAEEESIAFTESFDALYDAMESFDGVYEAIAERILTEAKAHQLVGYVVPGHPSFGERAVELIRAGASENGIDIQIVASPSYLDAVMEGETQIQTPLRILDALDLIRPAPIFSGEGDMLDPAALHVIYQVYDRAIASETKLALLEAYPPDAKVTIVTAAGVPGFEQRITRDLSELDHAGAEFNHLTTVLAHPLLEPELAHTHSGLSEIMARLRNPKGGCPWDIEQTPQSLRKFLIEEAYEVIDAIDANDDAGYAEELGDLLLQVYFHAQLARESGRFAMRDILSAVTSKLVRRHPHVFGDVEAHTAEQVLANWAAIKKNEKGYEERKSVLDGVPRAMPALMRAQEISKRAAKTGFEWDSIEGVFEKLSEEVQELRDAIGLGESEAIKSELGDILFTAVNLARFLKVDAEEALSAMLERFGKRFRRIEEAAQVDGRSVSELSLTEMERVWEAAKRE